MLQPRLDASGMAANSHFPTLIRLPLLALLLLVLALPAGAETVRHDGFLIGPTGQPLNGTYDITFTLYEGSASRVVWSEKHNAVDVRNGSFSVKLGATSPFESGAIDWKQIHLLGIRAGSGDEQKPRTMFDPDISAAKKSASTPRAKSPSVSVSAPSISVATGPTISVSGGAGHEGSRNNPHHVTAAQIGAATLKDIDAHTQRPDAHHVKTKSFTELEDRIGSGQIGPDTISGSQIRNASIKGEDIADRTITAKKIAAGTGSGLDADLIDGMQANEIIAAARDEVRSPISKLPFTISKPGSYFLTSDLKAVKQPGIIVKTDNVTIDLMGFSLIGDGTKVNGISLEGTHNVAVRNGSIIGFGATGIFTSSGDGHRISQVRAINNGSGGIFAFSSGTLVGECLASGNNSVGIAVGANSIIRNSVSRANQGNGISAENGGSIAGNTVYGNKGEYGISATGSTIKDNSVHENADTGIFAANSTLVGNTVSGNAGWGIQATDGTTVLSNTVSINNKGDKADKGGISVADDCQIKGNTVVGNKQNNIHVSGSDNMIEENLVTDSLGGNGINFAHPANGPQNFFANNRASGNGNNYAGNPPTGKNNGGGNVSF